MPELRFLCIGDTHGVVPDALPEGKFDAILHAGDLDDDRALRELERMARRKRLSLTYVLGNHDADISPDTANDLTGRALRIADRLVIAGIGCPAKVGLMPTDGEIEKACTKTIAATKATVRKGDRLIILSHYPPVLQGSSACCSVSPGIFSPSVGDGHR
jgi:predicted phosphodiesterase